MEVLQANTLTVAQYQGWNNLPKDTVIGYARTVFKESHRLTDEWSFSVKARGLYDDTRGGYVHEIVKSFPHPNIYLRGVEDGIISAMDNWATSDQKGFLVWISPSFIGQYPCHKIEILRKTDNGTRTENIAVLFDGSQQDCLEVAKRIFPEIQSLNNIEELRNSIFTYEHLSIDEIVEIVGPYLPQNTDQVSDEQINKHLEYVANLALSGASQTTIAYEMERVGLIGKHSFSCPGGGLSNVLLQRSNIIEAKYVKNCGNCGVLIDAHITKGYVCKSCGGVYEGC